jgi:hypothetical protein
MMDKGKKTKREGSKRKEDPEREEYNKDIIRVNDKEEKNNKTISDYKKERNLFILKIIAWALTGYLFLNLTMYVLAKINHITFWGSLIIIAIITTYGIPRLKEKIEKS